MMDLENGFYRQRIMVSSFSFICGAIFSHNGKWWHTLGVALFGVCTTLLNTQHVCCHIMSSLPVTFFHRESIFFSGRARTHTQRVARTTVVEMIISEAISRADIAFNSLGTNFYVNIIPYEIYWIECVCQLKLKPSSFT